MLASLLLIASVVATAPEADAELTSVVEASPSSRTHLADSLFPERGRLAATFSSGVPYLAIGEVAYGFSDRFALGVMGGVTPSTYGIGVRVRGVVADWGRAKLVLGTPLLYYPATHSSNGEPWVLALPTLRLDLAASSRVHFHVEAGAALATCTGSLAALFGGKHSDDDGEGFMGGAWSVVGGGVAWQTGEKTVLFLDALLVSRGFRVANTGWIGGPPVVLTLGAKYAL